MRCEVEQTKASELVRQGDHAAFLDTASPSPELGPQVGGHGEVIQNPSQASLNLQEEECTIFDTRCPFRVCQTMESCY